MFLRRSALFVFTFVIFFSDQNNFVFGANSSNNEAFGYELLTSQIELLDYSIKAQMVSLVSGIKELVEATTTPKKLAVIPRSCKESQFKFTQIHPEKGFREPFFVQCDQEYEGGGWTVIQNRFDGSVNFVRPWDEFKNGFGHLEGEFWLGLERIHQLTYGRPHELHILLEDFDGMRVVAKYSKFAIGSEAELFKITNLGTYSGTAGDSFTSHKDNFFTTFDRDNDQSPTENCAKVYSGAWWHANCHASNLNGLYLNGTTATYANGMCWNGFRGYHYSLKSSKMLIKNPS
ncbi:ficolin-2-like [Topomyia yanbarensis]|uniref:ficolin-2-like n=1 Tax=Topomyia yanbarensis TaxID=2498891 RepID=UPI00273BFD18|nr:ficolin-2-like [Topomyia yanbarensis]